MIRRWLVRRLVDVVAVVLGPSLERAARRDVDDRGWPDA